jgi:hypothetical protein
MDTSGLKSSSPFALGGTFLSFRNGARVASAFTEHGGEKVGRAVEHLRSAGDMTFDAEERHQPIEAAQRGADLRQYVERREPKSC